MAAVYACTIITAGVLLVAANACLAQSAGRVLRVAIIDASSESAQGLRYQAFRKQLGVLGYKEPGNLAIEARYAQGVTERLPALAVELVALKPDVIVAYGTPPTRAAAQATSTIPIVFIAVADPVASRLVASFARPGGNATGLSSITTEVGAKWIELLREIVPGGQRFAYLTDVSNSGAMLAANQLREHARLLGADVEIFDGRQATQLERSLETIARARFAGLIVGQATLLMAHRERILQFAARQKLPAIYARREFVDAGGLVSYGADLDVQFARAADYVHRIAQGAKPAELPVERPDILRMVLNLRAARNQGIAIPPSIRHRADELID